MSPSSSAPAAALTDALRAARPAGPGEPEPGRAATARRRAPAGLAGATTWTSCRARASSTRSPSRRPRRSRRSSASAGTRSPRTPARRRTPTGSRPRTICWPTGSRRWWPPPRWAWASTSPTSASSSTSARPPPPSPTTSRWAARAVAWSTPRCCCCPGQEDEAIWRYFASLAFPPEEQVRRTLDVLAAGRPAAVAARAGAAGRAAPLTAGDDAQGPRRGRRGASGSRAAGRPRAGRGRTTPSGTPGWRGSGQAEQQAMRDYADDDGVPHGVPAAAAGRRGGGAVRPLRQLRGRTVHRRGVRRGAGRARGASWAARAWRWSRARCGRRGSPRSASTSRAASRRVSRPRQAGRWAGSRTSAGATGSGRCSPPQAPDGPVPDDVSGAVVDGARRLGARARAAGPRGRRTRPRGRSGVVDRRLAHAAPAGPVARRADRRGRPDAAAGRRRRTRRGSESTRGSPGATAHSGCARCTGR